MQHTQLDEFINVISKDIGLQVRARNRVAFRQVVDERVQALGQGRVEVYGEILTADTEIGQQERERLARVLSVDESYFFRDRSQFALLRETVLPELIARNKDRRSLRIWSAGCATGEEPFSLAMLLDELLPNQADWHIRILGTDIRGTSLAHARQGVYRDWSFRGVDVRYKEAYFQKHPDGFLLRPHIRQRVRFEAVDLIRDVFPNSAIDLAELDLILCRNVFIYFERQSIVKVLNKFSETLKDDGYLLTGHAELYDQDMCQFQTRIFSHSVIYQRTTVPKLKKTDPETSYNPLVPARKVDSEIVRKTPKHIAPTKVPVLPKDDVDIDLERVSVLLSENDYRGVIAAASSILAHNPDHAKMHCLLGIARANLGDYVGAIQGFEASIACDAFDKDPYYLMAHICEEQGLEDKAKMLYNKCIYLDPHFAPPYMQLGLIYEKEKDAKRAKRMFQSALQQLQNMPDDALADPFGEDRVTDWVAQIEDRL